MKKIYIALLVAGIVPVSAGAITVYTYDQELGPVGIRSYEPTGIEKTAEEAFQAVVAIDGYKEVPIYALDRGGDGAAPVELGTVLRRVSSGSGFFIAENGYVLTNKHVIDDPDAAYVVDTGSSEMRAEVVYRDPKHDLAIIKISGDGYPVIPVGESSGVGIGDEVVSVGNALGEFTDSLSAGTVISLDETVIARDGGKIEELNGLIATDARLYPGDSGGPLLNADGEAVGVNVAIIAGTDVSFSVPIDAIRSVLARAGLLEIRETDER